MLGMTASTGPLVYDSQDWCEVNADQNLSSDYHPGCCHAEVQAVVVRRSGFVYSWDTKEAGVRHVHHVDLLQMS